MEDAKVVVLENRMKKAQNEVKRDEWAIGAITKDIEKLKKLEAEAQLDIAKSKRRSGIARTAIAIGVIMFVYSVYTMFK